VSFEREVFPSLVGSGLYGLEINGYWLDIGTPERYLQGTRDILSGRVRTGVDLGPDGLGIDGSARVDPRAQVTGPVLVGRGSEIHAGVRLGPNAVLADGCRIADGALVEDSVLHKGARLEPRAVVRESIIGPGARVGADARVEDCSILGEGSVVDSGAALAGARV
jgi:mannose-1-phosphate guanylyltransferase